MHPACEVEPTSASPTIHTTPSGRQEVNVQIQGKGKLYRSFVYRHCLDSFVSRQKTEIGDVAQSFLPVEGIFLLVQVS